MISGAWQNQPQCQVTFPQSWDHLASRQNGVEGPYGTASSQIKRQFLKHINTETVIQGWKNWNPLRYQYKSKDLRKYCKIKDHPNIVYGGTFRKRAFKQQKMSQIKQFKMKVALSLRKQTHSSCPHPTVPRAKEQSRNRTEQKAANKPRKPRISCGTAPSKGRLLQITDLDLQTPSP